MPAALSLVDGEYIQLHIAWLIGDMPCLTDTRLAKGLNRQRQRRA
jgi:hypothetical protein